ncbi:MAG TPA: sigma-70 family RNA polymerase sigma factor [Solirubrobacterales bacterium]
MSPPPAEQFAARVFLGPTLRAQPDRRLVGLVRDGYDAAFEEIVRRYRRPLDRFAAAIVGGRSEDVTQDAFSKALLALRGTEAEIELRPWLYRIVRNTALNDLRDRGPAAEELDEAVPGARSAAAVAESRQELRELMERLQALPEPQRAALVMRELEGLSHEEIAAALGVSGGAARQTIYRARAALREGLGLLMPLPIVRALAEHGDDAARAGGALAGAGASSAGGAALGGLGGGALKAGMAAVLIAGTVGAGVAIEYHPGDRPGPEAAEAATLPQDSQNGRSADRSGEANSGSQGSEDRHGGGHSGDDRGGDHSGPGGGVDDGDRTGSNDVSGHSGSGPGHSGNSDRHDGSSPNSGPGSISDGHHESGDDDGGDDHSGPGSGSDDSFDDHSGTSGDSGSDDGSLESGGDSSGSGSGEIEPEHELEPDPVIDDGSGSGSDSGSDSSGEGSGDLTNGETSSLDG